MTKPAEVTTFPKKCAHGVPMRHVKKMSGSWWEPGECIACLEVADAWDEANEVEMDAFCESVKARKNEEAS